MERGREPKPAREEEEEEEKKKKMKKKTCFKTLPLGCT
jgi:hypothetical protein